MRIHQRIYLALSATEHLVAGALKISEPARMSRTEVLLRQYIMLEWGALSRVAISDAREHVARGESADDVLAALDSTMRGWATRVGPHFVGDIQQIYKTARIAGWRKAKGKTTEALVVDTPHEAVPVQKAPPELTASFDAVDLNALDAIRRDQLFWIGQHYDAHVRSAIHLAVREQIFERGLGREAAAEEVQRLLGAELKRVSLPSGWTGTARGYFESLTANAATTARAQGQLRSFSKGKIEYYEIVNPQDDRTCDVCGHMDGKVFSVDSGIDQMNRLLAAKAPDDVRAIQPWIGAKMMRELAPTRGRGPMRESSALSEAGFQQPPFHFRCRCSVDMYEAEEGTVETDA